MVKAIVGANWGDEGKGKITDVLAANSDMVIRFQGGSNAGHTIINNYGRFALHQLPSDWKIKSQISKQNLKLFPSVLRTLIRVQLHSHKCRAHWRMPPNISYPNHKAL